MSHVIFELTGPDAGQTVRKGGFDWIDGELHVPLANVGTIEPVIVRFYGAKRKGEDSLPESTLRGDGPTMEQHLATGHSADTYPPEGYAARQSPAYTRFQVEQAAQAAQENALGQVSAPVVDPYEALPYRDVLASQLPALDEVLTMKKAKLASLNGIGAQRAQEIIDWRKSIN